MLKKAAKMIRIFQVMHLKDTTSPQNVFSMEFSRTCRIVDFVLQVDSVYTEMYCTGLFSMSGFINISLLDSVW